MSISRDIIFNRITNTYEVNIATPWMISRIKKVNIELFFLNFFSESRHDFRKFSPVKQVIKKVWPNMKTQSYSWKPIQGSKFTGASGQFARNKCIFAPKISIDRAYLCPENFA